MSVFFLKSEQREHLKLMREKSTEVVVDFCKLALDYLINGPNEKKYTSFAKKLNISTEMVQATVEALVFLLIDARKSNVKETELGNLKTLGFSAEQVSILTQFLSSKRNFVENILKSTSTEVLRFRDIAWRMEAKISSRCLLNQSSPIITIKFFFDTQSTGENRDLLFSEHSGNDTRKEVVAQIDPHNLTHLLEVLERALVESKTHRSKSILGTFQ